MDLVLIFKPQVPFKGENIGLVLKFEIKEMIL
jgi:hypothetical protein